VTLSPIKAFIRDVRERIFRGLCAEPEPHPIDRAILRPPERPGDASLAHLQWPPPLGRAGFRVSVQKIDLEPREHEGSFAVSTRGIARDRSGGRGPADRLAQAFHSHRRRLAIEALCERSRHIARPMPRRFLGAGARAVVAVAVPPGRPPVLLSEGAPSVGFRATDHRFHFSAHVRRAVAVDPGAQVARRDFGGHGLDLEGLAGEVWPLLADLKVGPYARPEDRPILLCSPDLATLLRALVEGADHLSPGESMRYEMFRGAGDVVPTASLNDWQTALPER
jgi:hypothetical protein